MSSVPAQAAIALLMDLAKKLETGEIEVAAIRYGDAPITLADPYAASTIRTVLEIHVFTPVKKSEC